MKRRASSPSPLARAGRAERTSPLGGEARREGATCRPAGFTLIELVITVAIIGILAAGLLPLTQLAAQRSKEQALRSSLREIRSAIDAYRKASDEGRVERKADRTGYPPTLEILAEGVKDVKSPDGSVIYFLRRVPRDPFSDDPEVAAEKSWGLRSYASPHDDPQPGDDVYDVYSLSERTGLNGVPYRQW
jgi:general secretion pathway protein G